MKSIAMTTYSGKLCHNANETARLVVETVFSDSEKANAFLEDVLALILKHS